MKEIDLASPRDLSTMPVNTFLAYGDTKTGKTTWAGTFPRTLFLSDISEGGYESLREENWNDDATPLFEDGVRPIVWGMHKQADMAEAIEKVKPLIASGRVRTIVIDSATFYADLYLNFILMSQDKPDNRQAYGKLGVHLRNIRISLHDLGVNVIWLALAKHPETDEKGAVKFKGRPQIPGEQSDKFMAGVQYTLLFRSERPQPTQPPRFEVRSRDYANYIAGCRLGKRTAMLPDPMIGPTYSTMMTALGYDVDKIRASLPDLSKVPVIKTTSAPKVQTPPVTVAPKNGAKITVVQK
jgi:hypothetical protein